MHESRAQGCRGHTRVPHARKGAGGTRGCPCARARGHSRECPCARAPTTVTSPVPPTGLIDSVVQIQATIVFLGARCGNCFAPSQIWCFFFQHTIFLCETALFGNDQITKQYKVTPCYDLLGTHGVELLGTHGVELLLHLAEHGLMKLVPIYMF